MNKKVIKNIKSTKRNDIVSSNIFCVLSFVIIKLFLGGIFSEEIGISLLSIVGILYLIASKTFLKKADEVVSEKWYHFIDVVNSDTSEVATLISGIVMIPAFVAAFHYGPSLETLAFWGIFGGASMTTNYLLKTKLTSLEGLLAKKLKLAKDKVEVKLEAAFWAE